MLKDEPLRKKLTIIVFISSSIVLIATISAFILYEINTSRPRILHNLEGVADLYNATLPAALSFNDYKAASENLSTMKTQNEINLACIYKSDGSIFAKYVRLTGKKMDCPIQFSGKEEFFLNGHGLQVVRKINYANEVLGHLLIHYDMPPLFVRLTQYRTILIAVSLSLIFMSILFIVGFEKKVIRPILNLEAVAREISSKKNYKLRGKKTSQDEIGNLTDEINHMLNTLNDSFYALYESESKFRRVSESNMIGIIFVDVYGQIKEANDYFLRMIGYSREELQEGKINWSQITPKEYQNLNQKAISELNEQGVYHPFEKEYFRKDGSRVAVLLGGAFLEGSKTDIVDFVLDITQRKRVEIENAKLLMEEHKARTSAEESLQIREDFMSIAAHELRTPLMPLKLQLGFIKNGLKTSNLSNVELLLKYINSSEEQINRLSRLIEDMLDVAHFRTGHFSLNLENVDVTELINSVVERYQPELKKLKIELNVTIKTQLKAYWDRLRIEQVLLNLVMNAIKYGEKKPINITVESNGHNAVLVVEDFGIGITKKDQNRIFNRFERAVSTNNFGGLGLGLYISRQIVEAHNGTISVVSEPGMGARFIVELPLEWPLVNMKDSAISTHLC